MNIVVKKNKLINKTINLIKIFALTLILFTFLFTFSHILFFFFFLFSYQVLLDRIKLAILPNTVSSVKKLQFIMTY